MEQKATIDAVFALALGLYTYVNPATNCYRSTKFGPAVDAELQGGLGGIMNVEKDPVQAAEAILAHIEVNRKKLSM